MNIETKQLTNGMIYDLIEYWIKLTLEDIIIITWMKEGVSYIVGQLVDIIMRKLKG